MQSSSRNPVLWTDLHSSTVQVVYWKFLVGILLQIKENRRTAQSSQISGRRNIHPQCFVCSDTTLKDNMKILNKLILIHCFHSILLGLKPSHSFSPSDPIPPIPFHSNYFHFIQFLTITFHSILSQSISFHSILFSSISSSFIPFHFISLSSPPLLLISFDFISVSFCFFH